MQKSGLQFHSIYSHSANTRSRAVTKLDIVDCVLYERALVNTIEVIGRTCTKTCHFSPQSVQTW
jgi:hypothetical protein